MNNYTSYQTIHAVDRSIGHVLYILYIHTRRYHTAAQHFCPHHYSVKSGCCCCCMHVQPTEKRCLEISPTNQVIHSYLYCVQYRGYWLLHTSGMATTKKKTKDPGARKAKTDSTLYGKREGGPEDRDRDKEEKGKGGRGQPA
ncbi:uncharacterized protein BO72DRAFT_145125 [Aspergillus fijiensis CBS 313.89]|uniref:Uncharacterized protein n=1 Tax=Aspergillus fijiensis CBS 313.89 TaxID=1448319 RepID=A0A8G1VYG4_9EURO|nr:uncharacterized protein BO72DRAFT_145125 [Aspergillus fijiensis CBS 313.89]RAK76276.1 hypothetical protein BO72DRAFT_145125 [Aspergillus fijiensis CBS 313.89]